LDIPHEKLDTNMTISSRESPTKSAVGEQNYPSPSFMNMVTKKIYACTRLDNHPVYMRGTGFSLVSALFFQPLWLGVPPQQKRA
jgi:hypothetical protein